MTKTSLDELNSLKTVSLLISFNYFLLTCFSSFFKDFRNTIERTR